MNKFGTRNMQFLIEELRIEAARIERGEEAGTVRALPKLLTDAADTLAAAQQYHGAVEAACV